MNNRPQRETNRVDDALTVSDKDIPPFRNTKAITATAIATIPELDSSLRKSNDGKQEGDRYCDFSRRGREDHLDPSRRDMAMCGEQHGAGCLSNLSLHEETSTAEGLSSFSEEGPTATCMLMDNSHKKEENLSSRQISHINNQNKIHMSTIEEQKSNQKIQDGPKQHEYGENKQMENGSIFAQPIPELDLSFLKNNYLFDRTNEVKKLHEAFHRSLFPYSQQEFILISGNSGTGKSVLADKLKDIVSSKGGYYIRGKFDQLQKPKPYSAFVSAFTELVRMVLEQDSETINDLKQSIRIGVKSDKQLLVGIFASLRSLIKHTQSDGDINIMGAQVQSRLKIAVRNFIASICSIDAPLVLVMDDLQWADPESLDLLESLLSNKKKVEGLILIGIYRSDEVSFDHNFAAILRRIGDETNVLLSHIMVNPLSWDSANDMISKALRLPSDLCIPVTELLFEKTGGNVLFFIELLQQSFNDRLFIYDDTTSAWIWDEQKLFSESNNYNLADLFTRGVTALPDKAKTVLMLASCLGAESDLELLSIILKDIDVSNSLQICIDRGIVDYDTELQIYSFRHDQIQQAAYSLIPVDEKPLMHVTIGRVLLKTLSQENLEKRFFLVVDQMVRGAVQLEDQTEKSYLASLCFEAGKKAIQSSSFGTASIYFWQGIDLFGNQHWRDEYHLSLSLYSLIAETECCNGDFEKMDKAIQEVLTHARSSLDKIRVYSVKVYSLWTRVEQQEAIDIGVKTLESLGISFPKKIRKTHIIKEVLKTKCLLFRKSISVLLGSPDMVDPKITAAMVLLNHLMRYALVARQNLYPMIATQLVQLSLKYGLCINSANGFCAYAGILITLNDFGNAFKYVELSLGILDRYKEKGERWLSRVHAWVYGVAYPWQKPTRLSLKPLLNATKKGMETGDIEAVTQSSWMHNYLAFTSGARLSYVAEKLNENLEMSEKLKQFIPALTMKLQAKAIDVFRKNSDDDPLSLSGICIDDKGEKIDLYVALHDFWCLILACYYGNTKLAINAAKTPPMDTTLFKITILSIVKCFYVGLASLDAVRICEEKDRKDLMEQVKKIMKELRKYASVSAHNCMNKILLLEAELAGIQGKMELEDIMKKYDQSILYASDEGFLHEEALANERASLLLRRRHRDQGHVNLTGNNVEEKDQSEKKYFDNAVALYQQWGANGKVMFMLRHQHGESNSFQC